MPPQTQTQYDPSVLSKDMDFRNAPTPQKIAYLSSVDPDFAKASPQEQAGYINHVLGNDVETPFEKSAHGAYVDTTGDTSKGYGVAAGVGGGYGGPGSDAAEHIGNAIADAIHHPREMLSAGSEFGKNTAMGLPNTVATLADPSHGVSQAISRTRQMLANDAQRKTQGRSPTYRATAALGEGMGVPVQQMEHGAETGHPAEIVGAGGAAGAAAVLPSVLHGVADATLPARTALAERINQPLVYEGTGEAGADTRMGIVPERGLVKEGIWGTRKGMVNDINKRLSLLKPAGNAQLTNSPVANVPIDATSAINSAVDDAITQAQKNGQSSVVPRLEELRDSLLTKHGTTTGTPLEINNLKTSIQNTASQLGAFKNTVPAEASAAKAAGQASSNVRSQVNDAVPEAADTNQRMSDLIDARSGLQRGMEAQKGKPVFGGGGESVTSRVLNATVGSPLVRSGAARVLSLGAKADIPTVGPPPPPPPGPLYQTPAGPTATAQQLSSNNPPPPPAIQVPTTGPGGNVALFPDIPTGQGPSGVGEIPNWPPKVPDWSAVNNAPPIPSAESTIPRETPYGPPNTQGPPSPTVAPSTLPPVPSSGAPSPAAPAAPAGSNTVPVPVEQQVPPTMPYTGPEQRVSTPYDREIFQKMLTEQDGQKLEESMRGSPYSGISDAEVQGRSMQIPGWWEKFKAADSIGRRKMLIDGRDAINKGQQQ